MNYSYSLPWLDLSKLTEFQQSIIARLNSIVREACHCHTERTTIEHLVIPPYEDRVRPCPNDYITNLRAVLEIDPYYVLRYHVDNPSFPRDYFEAILYAGANFDLIWVMGNVSFAKDDIELAIKYMSGD